MTNNIYIIDSSSLIELHKHNAMDVYVSVWNNINMLIEKDRLVAPQEVFNEIANSDDQLAKWAKNQKKLFKHPTEKQLNIIKEILKKYPELIDVDARYSADPFIIALAIEMATNPQTTLFEIKRVVVTEEKIRGNKIKIPYVCKLENIESISIIEMFREEQWKF